MQMILSTVMDFATLKTLTLVLMLRCSKKIQELYQAVATSYTAVLKCPGHDLFWGTGKTHTKMLQQHSGERSFLCRVVTILLHSAWTFQGKDYDLCLKTDIRNPAIYLAAPWTKTSIINLLLPDTTQSSSPSLGKLCPRRSINQALLLIRLKRKAFFCMTNISSMSLFRIQSPVCFNDHGLTCNSKMKLLF